MTRKTYREVFPNRHTFLVVVHAVDEVQVARNVLIAHSSGADGVFLINHRFPAVELVRIYKELVRTQRVLDGFWIGLNCLGWGPSQTFRNIPRSVSGVWTDNAQIDERLIFSQKAYEDSITREASGWPGLYFGGVAFKYQRQVEECNLAMAASIATEYVDVVTTSGLGTGTADIRKIEKMRGGLGGFPLAVASGITLENVDQFKPLIDCFLVNTGISVSETELDPAKVSALAEKIKS